MDNGNKKHVPFSSGYVVLSLHVHLAENL